MNKIKSLSLSILREMDMKTDSGLQHNKCSASGKDTHRRQVPYLGIKEVKS